MRRNLLGLLLILSLVSVVAYLRRGHVVTVYGIHPEMSSSEIEARLGPPQQRGRHIKNPVEWDYSKLHLGVDFVLMGQGTSCAHNLYSQRVEVDGQVFERGVPVESIVRVLGTPEIRVADLLRFQVLTGVLDVSVDRRTQIVMDFLLRRRVRPPHQP